MRPLQSIRLRLLLLALLPLVVLMPLLLGVTMVRWINRYDELLLAKVASDLRVAEQFFGRIEAAQAADVTALAQSVRFSQARAAGGVAFSSFLDAEKSALGLDFLLYGGTAPGVMPEAVRAAAEASESGGASAGLAVFSAQDLASLSAALQSARLCRLCQPRLPVPSTTMQRPEAWSFLRCIETRRGAKFL